MGRETGRTMKCDVCQLDTKLFFYKKENLVYALCKSCLRVQDQLDEVGRYQRLLENIDKGWITKEDL
jgi:hypothetical protein